MGIYCGFVVIALLVAASIAGLKKKEKNIFKGLAIVCYMFLHKKTWFVCRESYREHLCCMEKLTPSVQEERVKQWYVEKMAVVLALLLITHGILGLYCGYQWFQKEKPVVLTRQEFDGEDQAYQIAIGKEQITYKLAPRQYSVSEKKEIFEDGFKKVKNAILGANTDLMHITKSLTLVEQVEELPVQIAYEMEDNEFIGVDGILIKEPEEPTKVSIQVTLSLGEEKRSQTIFVMVVPKNYSKKELQLQEYKKMIKDIDQQSATKKQVTLPKEISGERVQLEEKNSNTSVKLLLLGIGLVVLFWFYQWEQNKKMQKERKNNLLEQYPDFIHSLVLYLGAGLSVRNGLSRIVEQLNRQEKTSYLQIELQMTIAALRSGEAEMTAYETFAKRTRLQEYVRCMTMINQNISKGNEQLLPMLEQEVVKAFEEQKEYAKTLGEQAGTKLLLPMMMLLVLILILIMVPALFQI